MRRSGQWRWQILAGGSLLVVVVILFGPPAMHMAGTWLSDHDEREVLPAGFIDDASRMNATPVQEVWSVPESREDAERQLVELLRRADQRSLPVSIAGARHSMGGHVIAEDGIVIDMLPFDDMALDVETDILHVQSGATWDRIIEYLDRYGMSVGVMQSNNSFSVGGSLSVNCHGWQYGRPPIASTVRSFRLMRADGSIVTCSREENRELFSLVLGGYGLFGIILDVQLEVVPNVRLQLEQFVVPIDNALGLFEQSIEEHPGASMVYARLNIIPEEFLEEAIVSIFRAQEGDIPALTDPYMIALRRVLFRGSAESDYGKELRWAAETKLQPLLTSAVFSRNQLLNEGVETFQNRSASSTDILHEYFIPRDGIDAFLEELRRIVPLHDGNLLNVTVRSVDADEDTFLRYADGHMFAFVMLFQQPRTNEGEEAMRAMTREMIEASLAVDGCYYLPYRLHATKDQFHRAYPMGREFFERKRDYDPGNRFQNRFHERYGDRHRERD